MEIEDIKIEDAADANYVIRKFFKGELKNIKISQLEQLILTVYNLGKNNSASAGSESPVPEAPPEPPFKVGDKVRIIEDIEIGHSGEFINKDTAVTVNSVKEDKISFWVEAGEDGEMFEASVSPEKLEKIG